MKISGYKLIDRLEELKEQAKTVDAQFVSSLHKFDKEIDFAPDVIALPQEIMQKYADIQTKIGKLQEAQTIYNIKVKVKIQDEVLTLNRAIKEYGSIGHVKNQWKTASVANANRSPYYGFELSRNKEQIYAVRTISIEDSNVLYETANKQVGLLKQGIRSGNATEINIEIDESVFED